ncbi:MAG: DUF5706 domain-containing protein [Lutibacter sp.]|uniref:Pycsar system effector family protein n=1 Tax=Lutibacter sp. TaxID=1925666 RepID=UPI00385BCAC7
MNSILQKAESFVLNSLNKNLSSEYVYHTFHHTQFVVSKINEIIQIENLTDDEKEIVLLAGWFHDIGYTVGKKQHEDHSIKIATDFLTTEGYESFKIEQISDCINATKLNETPSTLLQEILCDADFAHFASKNYPKISNQLKTEFENIGCGTYSNQEWMKENIKVFKNHKYYTKYANLNWDIAKNENLISIKKELKKAIKKAKEKEISSKRSERSIDTLFRVTLKNHITLSDIADTKANILLSVNAIIISMALSNLIPKFDNPNNFFLIYPTIIFVLFSVISMVLSVLATRPSVTSGKFTKEDVDNKKVNLLFFGNFHKMKLNEFEAALNVVMNDKDYLYASMTKDLYFLGQVLDKKYKILRWTYSIFMIGIITSVIAFAISYNLLSK